MTTSKTAAIRQAQKETGKPIRRFATDWVFYGPYRIGGHDTEIRAISYQHAVTKRTAWVAELALHAMGKCDESAKSAIESELNDSYGARGVSNLVDCGMAAFGKGSTEAEIAAAAQSYWDAR